LVCQTGTQQRSGAHYRRAKEEFFDQGRLGKVIFARAVWHDFPWQRRKVDPQPRPAGLDWERFLGPAPKVPYEWIRYDAWRYFPDYGGGLLADILTHWADVAQWMMDESRPLNAVATGGIYQFKDGRMNPDTVNAIIQYPSGWNLTFESSVLPIRNERPGVFFQGTEGTLELTRAEYVFTPNKGEPQIVKAEGHLEVAHATDFLEAIKHGRRPSADIQIGVEACNPVHLAKAAYWRKRRMQFDATGAKIVEAV
jgi:predicted dehydrogenase